MSKHKISSLTFGLFFTKSQSDDTQKELFLNMDCNKKSLIDSNHILCSYMLIRKTDKSQRFFEECL